MFSTPPKAILNSIFFVILVMSTQPISAQFLYADINLGVQTGSLKIKNAISDWQYDFTQLPLAPLKMVDSIDTKYWITNFRVNFEVLSHQYYIKAGMSLPFHKSKEHNNKSITGKHSEVDFKFAYGFAIKKRVGFHFGINTGSFVVNQYSAGMFDYFVPSSGGTPTEGVHSFGNAAAWQIGGLVNNVIVISDKMALRTTFSYNFLNKKKTTLHGVNKQLDFAFYYYNPKWMDFGLTVNFTQNWIRYKGYNLDTPIYAHNVLETATQRIYPVTNVLLTTFYIGINIPVGASKWDKK